MLHASIDASATLRRRMTVPAYLTEIERELRIRAWDGDDPPWAWRRAGFTVGTLRGTKMRTVASLMDEVAAVLQFPRYFGENWAALDECIADLEWLLPTAGFVVGIRDPTLVLADEPDQLLVLVRILETAAREFSDAVELGESWDRSALPFHVVFFAGPDQAAEARQRWSEAGALFAT